MAWHRLRPEQTKRATIKVFGGPVYTATEIVHRKAVTHYVCLDHAEVTVRSPSWRRRRSWSWRLAPHLKNF
jgi:hypothetical protein